MRTKLIPSSVGEALEGRGVKPDASPEEKMREIVTWHLGDPNWWDTLTMWMDAVGYPHGDSP